VNVAILENAPLPLERGMFTTAAVNEPGDLIHACPRCGKHATLRFGTRGNGHNLTSRSPLSIVGSIICPNGCKAHYYVTNGEIVWAGDAA
jgi:hypothetical protein